MSSAKEDRPNIPLTPELKFRFVSLVKEHKSILFGRCTPTLRNVDKFTKWILIFDELTAHGAVIKDPTYLRDRLWDNLKRAALEKKKKLEKTGASGGVRYTDYELVTLEILDPASAYMSGLGQEERQPQFPGADSNEDSILNSTSQSIFNASLSTLPGGSASNNPPTFARPSTRTSSPVRLAGDDSSSATATRSVPAPKRQKRGPPENLWASEDYKALKVQQLQNNLEEQEIRIQLMKAQIEESKLRGEESKQRAAAEKERETFFHKAGIAIENSFDLQINRSLNVRL
jgi:hypothetical protein